MKKKRCRKPMWVLVLAIMISALPSCLRTGCEEKPVLNEYHYGLLDSMPEGTRVVFESNTGKLDTAVYGKVTEKIYQENVGGSGRCDEQVCNIHYKEQVIKFKNKFGLKQLEFIRFSNFKKEGLDSVAYLSFKIDSIMSLGRYPLDNYNFRFQIKQIDFDNCAMVSPISNYVKYATVVYSKRFGVIKLSYINSSQDSIFEFKNIIK